MNNLVNRHTKRQLTAGYGQASAGKFKTLPVAVSCLIESLATQEQGSISMQQASLVMVPK